MSGIYPDNSYVFKHALMREVVYGAILAKAKDQLHGKAADAIAGLHSDNLQEHYPHSCGALHRREEFYLQGAEYARLVSKAAEKRAYISKGRTGKAPGSRRRHRGLSCPLPRTSRNNRPDR